MSVIGTAVVFLALLTLVLASAGLGSKPRADSLHDRISGLAQLDSATGGGGASSSVPGGATIRGVAHRARRAVSPMPKAVVSAVAVGLIATLLGGPVLGLLVGSASMVALCSVPRRRTSRRRLAFASDLPDALTLLSGALSAGRALTPAVEHVARESHGAIADEWGRAVVESRLGLDLADALDRAGQRMHCAEMQWVVLAMRTNREVGGDLGSVLTTVAASLRERDRQRRHARALTAEGRLSAVILCALPVVFAAYLAAVRPEYLSLLWHSSLGLAMSVVAATLLAAGVIWMRLLVRIEGL